MTHYYNNDTNKTSLDQASLQKDVQNYMQKYKKKLHEMKHLVESNGDIEKENLLNDVSVISPSGEEIFKMKDDFSGREQIIKFVIYNVNGNSNEVSLVPPDISFSESTLTNLNEENVHKIVSALNNLQKENIQGLSQINIPIYIFNINNILSNGNKNEVSTK